ncbi:MAG: 4-alpha-glucanotransferase [Thermomicrobiales bacterium]
MPRARYSGVICHPTSFPGPHGIGDCGEEAFRFIEWLHRAGQTLWQVLPLGPVGAGNSPYASPSAFAGSALLISLPWLAGDDLLESQDVAEVSDRPQNRVDFDEVRDFKIPRLRKAFNRFQRGAASHLNVEFDAYVTAQKFWLDDFALFMALKEEFNDAPWVSWPDAIALREPEALDSATKRLGDEIRFHQFVQFLFDRQWREVRGYANRHGIRVIGDIPIFVAYDSADVWAHRELFRLDPHGHPLEVAGVPPDAFTSEGQFWGNPVYDWGENEATGFSWWIDRVRSTLERVDVLRIDHFRGFAASWVVPAGAASAAAGRWVQGPGTEVFSALEMALGKLPLLVEDLGLITSDVNALRESLGIPGMKVLQFAFDSGPTNAYLPHNFGSLAVCYTGTHDNQTTVGWFRTLPEHVRTTVQRYLGRDGSDIAWDFIRLALESVADWGIVPLQDVMRLDDDARMNTPGTAVGNWEWRYANHQLHDGLSGGLRELTETYGRTGVPRLPEGFDPFDYTHPGSAHYRPEADSSRRSSDEP